MAGKRKYRPGQYEAELFRALPERAQEIWFQYCEISVNQHKPENLMFITLCNIDYSDCKSPIEVIFKFAYDLIQCDEGFPDFSIYPQYEINIEGKKYIADFVFIAEESIASGIYNYKYKLVIECDGHKFHEKTKEQVAYDNEREYAFKMAGYDVIRFSGSQIYNNPFRCAKQAYEYIVKKVGE